jgi:hypothetical protein
VNDPSPNNTHLPQPGGQGSQSNKVAPSWGRGVAAWIGGLVLIISAIVSLLTALGKLDDALNPKLTADINDSLYALGLTRPNTTAIPGPPVELSYNGNNSTDATVSVPDGAKLLNIRIVPEPTFCKVEGMDKKAQPGSSTDGGTLYTLHVAALDCGGQQPNGRFHLEADVQMLHPPTAFTASGKSIFFATILLGIFIIIRRR